MEMKPAYVICYLSQYVSVAYNNVMLSIIFRFMRIYIYTISKGSNDNNSGGSTGHSSSSSSNKSAKGAYTLSSPVCLSMCEGSEYTSLSVTKRKIILNVTISKLLVSVSMSGIWFGVYINNISALV